MMRRTAYLSQSVSRSASASRLYIVLWFNVARLQRSKKEKKEKLKNTKRTLCFGKFWLFTLTFAPSGASRSEMVPGEISDRGVVPLAQQRAAIFGRGTAFLALTLP